MYGIRMGHDVLAVILIVTEASPCSQKGHQVSRAAADFDIPLITDFNMVRLFVESIKKYSEHGPALRIATDCVFSGLCSSTGPYRRRPHTRSRKLDHHVVERGVQWRHDDFFGDRLAYLQYFRLV